MTRAGSPLGNFEARLLAELKEHLATRTAEATTAPATARPIHPGPSRRWRAPGWRLAGVGGLIALLTVGGLVAQTVGGERPASAAEILTDAAAVARQQPELAARPDQFLFVELRITRREEPVSGPYVDERVQRWVPVGDDPSWQQRRRPEADPDGWRTEDVSDLSRPAGYVADLPTDPEEMIRYLRNRAAPEATEDDPVAPFVNGMLMLDGYLPPRSLGALFRAMAQVTGAEVAPGDVRDAAGRRGVALRMPGVVGAHLDLIFDRETHAYLGTRRVLVRDGRESLYTSTAIVRLAIVDRSGQLP
ncbi:CU044_5270 family protein [Micromonospora sp. NPDC092111]|uniref:CU044_5270 family protein n=1 Tax=Micromonospora sp. NPDC092111 TaxID=3364289 RepID=UPI00382DD02F